MGKLRKSH